jgi:hypothetical protein
MHSSIATLQEPAMESEIKRRKLGNSISETVDPLEFRHEKIRVEESTKEIDSNSSRKRQLHSEVQEPVPEKRVKRNGNEKISEDDVIYTDSAGRYMISIPSKKDPECLIAPSIVSIQHLIQSPERKQTCIQYHKVTITPPESPIELCSTDVERRSPTEDEADDEKITPHDEEDIIRTTHPNSKPSQSAAARNAVQGDSIKVIKKETTEYVVTSWSKFKRLWKLLLTMLCCSSIIHAQYSKQPFEKDCVYVNGGGFSGFWFMLGQLYKLREEEQPENYLCYSSGCLGAVSVLANRSFEELFDSALSIQSNWKSGSLSRFDALETFVDDLLGHNSTLDVSAFSKVKILTSVPTISGWELHVDSPVDMAHLRTLLIQTSWIPFVSGNNLWHSTGHMDGGFSRLQHPTCRLHISLPWDWNLLANAFNINMRKEEGERYWNLGLNH